MRILFLILLLGAGLSGCAVNPVTGKQNFVLISEEQELALGRQAHEGILKQYGLYDDQELEEYVSRVGETLARNSHRSNIPYSFYLLDSPMVNAFALPGGYVYITRGIMSFMENEAQLAGVLGHEIGHVTARHGVRQQSQGMVIGVLGGVAAAATGSSAVGDLSNALGSALISGYGRSHELEADRLGAEYLARSGYDPSAMIEVIGILKDQELYETAKAREAGRQPSVYHGVFASHPQNDDRLKEVIAAAGQPVNGRRPVDREAFLKRLDGMVVGDSAHQGVIRNGHFLHASLNVFIDLPAGWESENRPDRLISVAPDQSAVLQILLDTRKDNESPRAYIDREFPQSESRRALTVNGFDAVTLVDTINTPFGKRPSQLAAVFRDDDIFLFAAASRDGNTVASFDDTVRSLRSLTNAERQLAKPHHIDLVRAESGDTFTSILRKQNLHDDIDVDRLRLLNGRFPDGEPHSGELIKIVR
ncbi:MAG: hypothetical protein DHS20C01_12920 [marine bacterium B5-7]|nr:MAG: hypothetical protein DHS20C01_12920 [marine bacterium B5-7]